MQRKELAETNFQVPHVWAETQTPGPVSEAL